MNDGRKPPLFDAGFAVVAAIGLAAGTAVWVTQGFDRMAELLLADLLFAVSLLPKILAGVLVATLIPFLISRERILSSVGPESGWRGLVLAAFAGAIIPGGPGVTLPLATGLMAAGADLGAGVAMVTAWILIGFNRTLVWELSFLPADLVLYRFLLSAPVPVLLGLAARWLVLRGKVRG